MFRRLVGGGTGGGIEVLLVHPGGPFWAKKDDGAWSVPKGEYAAGDDPAACAAREFEEELGQPPPRDGWRELGEVTQPGGKRVVCWAAEGDIDVTAISSNEFMLEWPRGSGRMRSFPEVDRAGWFSLADARVKLLRGQVELLDRLEHTLRRAEL